jgi:hypothetical protein
MTHTVEIIENGSTVSTYTDCSKKEAIEAAKKESTNNNQVFISAYNGQCTVYLNPNMSYELTGKCW